MDSKNTWNVMKVLKQCIIDNNGIIFGGFVRDSIIHDHFSSAYYEKNAELSISDEEAQQLYANMLYMPETLGRLVIPHDIDCFMVENDYNMFINGLKDNRLTCKAVFDRTASEYINGFEKVGDDSLRHRRITVQVDVNHVLKELYALPIKFDRQPFEQQLFQVMPPPIVVDVITSKHVRHDPYLTDVDFECNSLYITRHGLSICPTLSKGLSEYDKWIEINRIISDIISKVAIYMHPNGTNQSIAKRVDNLIERGWTIDDYLKSITSVSDGSYEGHCIICHESVPGVHFKLTCCDARYHGHCLKRVLELEHSPFKQECIMCKAPLPIRPSHSQLFHSRA